MRDKKEDSYKFVIVCLCAVIVAMFAGFMFVVAVYVPDIVVKSNVESLDPLIRSAVSDEFESYIDHVNK